LDARPRAAGAPRSRGGRVRPMPIPARVYIDFPWCREARPDGLVELRWCTRFNSRDATAPVIRVDPRLLRPLSSYVEATAMVSIYEESQEEARRVVEILCAPIERPRAVFVAVAFPLRCTGCGAYDEAYVANEREVVWLSVHDSVSRSGRHGSRLIMALSKKPIRIMHMRRSNLGNARNKVIVYDFDGVREVRAFEVVSTVKRWRHGKLVRMRDNGRNEVITALVLTDVAGDGYDIEHEIEPSDAVVFLYSTKGRKWGRWIKVYEVLRPCRLRVVRIYVVDTAEGAKILKDVIEEVEVVP